MRNEVGDRAVTAVTCLERVPAVAATPAADTPAPPPHHPAAIGRPELAERARSGDRIAFERLIDPWIEPAYRTGLAILGRDADARDAVQDALLEAWRNVCRLREPDRFDAWLGRIHLNACHAIGRRRGRSSVREIALDALPDPGNVPGRAVAVDEQRASLDELERAFDRLSTGHRTTLVLHYLEHHPVAEIAARLGIAEGTVKWRLHEARNALARALEEERR